MADITETAAKPINPIVAGAFGGAIHGALFSIVAFALFAVSPNRFDPGLILLAPIAIAIIAAVVVATGGIAAFIGLIVVLAAFATGILVAVVGGIIGLISGALVGALALLGASILSQLPKAIRIVMLIAITIGVRALLYELVGSSALRQVGSENQQNLDNYMQVLLGLASVITGWNIATGSVSTLRGMRRVAGSVVSSGSETAQNMNDSLDK